MPSEYGEPLRTAGVLNVKNEKRMREIQNTENYYYIHIYCISTIMLVNNVCNFTSKIIML